MVGVVVDRTASSGERLAQNTANQVIQRIGEVIG